MKNTATSMALVLLMSCTSETSHVVHDARSALPMRGPSTSGQAEPLPDRPSGAELRAADASAPMRAEVSPVAPMAEDVRPQSGTDASAADASAPMRAEASPVDTSAPMRAEVNPLCAPNEAGFSSCGAQGVTNQIPCCMCSHPGFGAPSLLLPQAPMCDLPSTTIAESGRLPQPCTSWAQFYLCRTCPTDSQPDDGRYCKS